MAYNAMSVVRQSPYLISNNRGPIKKKEEEESSQSSHANEQENENGQIKSNEHKNDHLNQLSESKVSQQQAIQSRDASLKNATVNIAQILKDFRSTSKAIGAPPELCDEVNDYLTLVEKQVLKETPDTKLVRSNLKNASTLLDNYITETLQRPSKVVENWIDALFLQQINYKFNEEDINPHFLVKFPNGKKTEDYEDSSDEEHNEDEQNEENKEQESANQTNSIHIPKDAKLKSLFLQAKKYAYTNNAKKAMDFFKEALDRAIEVADKETESKVLYEIGKIYDKNDFLAQALTSYSKSLQATSDIGVKTQAHFSMAQIYDDVAQFEPAINHYMSSISYAGETENFTAQSTSLTKIGNIYTDEYKNEAFDFLLEANAIANESKNSKTKGYVSSNLAQAYNKFNKPQDALKYYFSAVKEYQDANSPKKIAINYKRAAEIMREYNNYEKSKVLFKKALNKARQTDDVDLMREIHDALSMV